MPWHGGYAQLPRSVEPDGGVLSDLDGAPAAKATIRVLADAILTAWGAVVSEVVACDQVAPVESIDIADADGSSNAVEQDTQTIPDGAAVGTVYQNDINNGNGAAVTKGRCIILRHKTQGTDAGSSSGAAYLFCVYHYTGQS